MGCGAGAVGGYYQAKVFTGLKLGQCDHALAFQQPCLPVPHLDTSVQGGGRQLEVSIIQ